MPHSPYPSSAGIFSGFIATVFHNGMSLHWVQLEALRFERGPVSFRLCASIARPAVKGVMDKEIDSPVKRGGEPALKQKRSCYRQYVFQ